MAHRIGSNGHVDSGCEGPKTCGQCPKWVKSCPDDPEVQLPLCTRKRTQIGHRAMSGSCQQETHAPQLTASSFDHLVDLREDGRRYGKAKHFGSLEVDNQIELRGLFHGQASRLGALEDLIDVAHGATVRL